MEFHLKLCGIAVFYCIFKDYHEEFDCSILVRRRSFFAKNNFVSLGLQTKRTSSNVLFLDIRANMIYHNNEK